MGKFKIAAGRTVPGQTDWKAEGDFVIYVDVDTSSGNFCTTPVYVTSLGGNAEHQQLVGVTSLYPPHEDQTYQGPTATGFRVRVNFYDARPLTPAQANAGFWHINWIGIELE